ncbi:MAG: DUF1573 domain-containing protein, partial [Fimbriiglobus sp.]|nr:DUF1573 domain-containing protein [Fimbriiglobus sp.]
LGVIGQATCGCFGIIQASPWAAFAVDVTALGLLAIGRPPLSNRAEVSSVLTWAGGLATIFAVLAVAGVLTFGSLDAALARLRGQSLSVSPVMLDFGSGKPGEVRTGAYSVRNNTSALVRLMGRTSDCNCLVGGEFPVEIPPGQSVTLTLDIRVPRSVPGQFTREVDVYTDLPQASRLTLLLTCLVERPE